MTHDFRSSVLVDLGFRAEALPQLERYVQLLWQSNEELNLFSRQMQFSELIDNHVIDCLLALAQFPPGVKAVADLGSGGGLPAVLYAIQFPAIQFHLFEKSPKKQHFLKRCREIAPNVQVHGLVSRELNGIDLVTARAFKPLDVILELTREYHVRGGRYFLLKGRREKIEQELAEARKKSKNLDPEIIILKSPILEVERHLVVIS